MMGLIRNSGLTQNPPRLDQFKTADLTMGFLFLVMVSLILVLVFLTFCVFTVVLKRRTPLNNLFLPFCSCGQHFPCLARMVTFSTEYFPDDNEQDKKAPKRRESKMKHSNISGSTISDRIGRQTLEEKPSSLGTLSFKTSVHGSLQVEEIFTYGAGEYPRSVPINKEEADGADSYFRPSRRQARQKAVREKLKSIMLAEAGGGTQSRESRRSRSSTRKPSHAEFNSLSLERLDFGRDFAKSKSYRKKKLP